MASRKPLVLGATGRASEVADADVLLAILAQFTTLTVAGFEMRSAATGLVAAGTTQATGLVLTKAVNVFATVGTTTANSCVLPNMAPPTGFAARVVLINRGANTLNVFPFSGAAIDAAAVNVAATIAAGAAKAFEQVGATQFFTG